MYYRLVTTFLLATFYLIRYRYQYSIILLRFSGKNKSKIFKVFFILRTFLCGILAFLNKQWLYQTSMRKFSSLFTNKNETVFM